jgi:heme A synthase
MKKMKKHVAVLAVILLAAMAAATWAQTKKAAVLPKDWMSYKFIGSLVITEKKSPLFGIHHFYMNKKGLDAFNKGGPYPDGTVIVDAVYDAVTG